MSNPNTVNSIINKLLDLPNKYFVLYFNGFNVDLKLAEIKQKSNLGNTVDEFNYKMLAVFLQYLDINLFSKEELEFLLNLDYSSLEINSVKKNTASFNFNKPLYDVKGSFFNLNQSIRNIETDFNQLHNLNKNLSIGFFISFITTQI